MIWYQYNRDGDTQLLHGKERKTDEDGQQYEGAAFQISDPEAIRMAEELYEYLCALRSTQTGKKVNVLAFTSGEKV